MADDHLTDAQATAGAPHHPGGAVTLPDGPVALFDRFFDRDRDPVEFGRIVALSDGVFAVAFTLLVLDLSLPDTTSDLPLTTALAGVQVQFVAFVISIAMVGTFFRSHHRLVRLLQRFDGTLLELTVFYLGLIVLIPLVQELVGSRPEEPLAYALYALVIGGASAVEAAMLWHAHRRRLLRVSLRGRRAYLHASRAVLPVVVFLTSAGLAFLIGAWTVILWLALWPLDGMLAWLERRG